jgi:uncharacterized membrane protein/mono/diheme cytochrome c family protein
VISSSLTTWLGAVGATVGLAVAGPTAFAAPANSAASEDGAALVAALIAERCASCHSPVHPDAAQEPRALRKWAGATDLATVIETVVVRGTPDESDLYLSVEFDEMPPKESASAPLTDEEKALIHAWITAGAPLPAASDGTPPEPPAEPDAAQVDEPDAPVPAETPARGSTKPRPSTLELIGRFHPTTVHFPIALLLAALPAALWARWRKSAAWATCADYCTALGALGAVVASALGWCAHEAGAGALQPVTLERHEWSGFIAAFLALVTLCASAARRRGRKFGRWYLPLLTATCVVVSVAGHFGGILVWGEDFLPLPF